MNQPTEMMHVPTVPELLAQGLARAVHTRGPVGYLISDEGQQMIYAAMKHNAEMGKVIDAERIAQTARDRYAWEIANTGPRAVPVDVEEDWRRSQRVEWKASA